MNNTAKQEELVQEKVLDRLIDSLATERNRLEALTQRVSNQGSRLGVHYEPLPINDEVKNDDPNSIADRLAELIQSIGAINDHLLEVADRIDEFV